MQIAWMKETRLINRFSEKILIWAILGPKIAHPHNSGSTGRILHNEKGQQVNESNNNGLYLKKIAQNKWAILVLKMAHHNSGSALRIFLKFWRMKNWGNVIFLAFGPFFAVDWPWSIWASLLLIRSLNSQDMISFMITTGSLNSQDMIRILKQWRHDFSGKHLCDGYCMDITWCLCVEFKMQGFVKLL